jgi:tryptophan synthase alpha chain
MSRIAEAFQRLSEEGSGAYIPYVCAGDPDKEFTLSLATRLLDSGADILELGVPFSDPVADGPVIQDAMQRSLQNSFRVAEVFEIVESIRRMGYSQPVVLMTYCNPVLRMGIADFCSRAARSGADAILMVDMPLEESEALDSHAKENALDVIRLVSPSTTDARIDELVSRGSGFLYAVSVSGVTGARASLPESARLLLGRLSRVKSLPVVLGFGISSPDHVRQAIAAGARGVVEGSAIVSLYGSLLNECESALEAVAQHASAMKTAAELK